MHTSRQFNGRCCVFFIRNVDLTPACIPGAHHFPGSSHAPNLGAAPAPKALAKHAQLSKDAKMGQGVDRHLYALNRLGVEAGREHPLFKNRGPAESLPPPPPPVVVEFRGRIPRGLRPRRMKVSRMKNPRKSVGPPPYVQWSLDPPSTRTQFAGCTPALPTPVSGTALRPKGCPGVEQRRKFKSRKYVFLAFWVVSDDGSRMPEDFSLEFFCGVHVFDRETRKAA